MLLQGTLGGNFDIFAASGEFTAWVLLWKTRSRPIGVRVCPVAPIQCFQYRIWSARVGIGCDLEGELWISASADLHLRTKEEIILIIHLRQLTLSLMILKFPLVHKVHNLRHLLNPMSSQVFLAYQQDGLQLHHLLVEEKE